ncbi:TRAP transporter large permease [Actinotalea sp.]|uniref:TRAP transporter large permease n=1 Tax=Actinotalea sp. TaxID=1872145 RepID=UPI003567D0F7
MDTASLVGLILLIGIFGCIALGFPIAVSIGLPSLVAIVTLVGFDSALIASPQRVFTAVNNFTLLAIPFFVLAGVLMNSGGIAGRLVDAAKVMVGKMPSSLAQTNVVANAMFGAVSGAAVAAAAAVGSVMTPRMVKEGYNRPFSAAVNVASAPAGMLIPPSNTLIVYSLASSTSIAALFMAGVGPGLLWTVVVMVVAFIGSRRFGGNVATAHVSFGQGLLVLWRAFPSMLMIVIVIGGILTGQFTATESSAIAVVYCLVLGFAYRTVKVADLPKILLAAARTTAIVMLLVGVSGLLSWVLSFARIPQLVADGLLGLSDNQFVITLLMLVILLVVGMFMDPVPAILIFTPIFLPLWITFGLSPIHFGTVITFAFCLGVITPPVGNVLFVGSMIAGLRVEPVIRRLLPFFFGLAVALLITAFLPALSTWLPIQMGLMAPT